MKKKIDISEFRPVFFKRSFSNAKALNILESNLILLILPFPHEKSLEFTNFLKEILVSFEIYKLDLKFLKVSYEIKETEFRNFVKKSSFRMQKFLEE